MSEHKQYEIKTVQDFLKVPEEKLGHCLQEFTLFIASIYPYKPLFDTGAVIPAFVWIDDGQFTTDADAAVDTAAELVKTLTVLKKIIDERNENDENVKN